MSPRHKFAAASFALFSLLMPLSIERLFASDTRILYGRALEAGTRRPLEGVRVCVDRQPDACGLSDAEGNFRIPLAEDGTFRLFIPGADETKFLTAPFTVSGENPFPRATVYYETEILTLPDILVTAPSDKDKISRKELTNKEFRQVPGTLGDPLKAIQTLPGVAVGSDSSSSPAIRGSRPEDNLYYVNDQPVGYLFHMGDLLSVFNSDLVQEFTIHASAFGPQYDSALGAVIDVRLREPRTDRWGAKLNISAFESDLLVEGPIGGTQSLLLAGRRSYLDLIVSQLGGGLGDEIEVVQFPEFYDYQGRYLWRPNPRNTFSVETSGAWDKLIIDVKSTSDIAARDPDLAGRFGATQNYHSQGVAWNSQITPDVSNRLVVSHLEQAFDITAASLGFGELSSENYVIYESLSFKPLENHDMAAGFRHTYSDTRLDFDLKIDFPSEFDPDVDFTSAERKALASNIYANASQIFLKDRWRALPRLTLLGGARATYDDFLSEGHVEPWAGLEYDLTEKTLLTGGWGTYHQSPPGQELVEPFGNPDLKSLEARHSVAGVRQRIGQSWSVQVEGYEKTFRNLTVPDPVKNYVNGASGRALGLEFLAKKDRTDRWNGWLSVSQSRSTRKNNITGQEIVFANDQPWILNAVATYWLTKKFSVGFNWRYHSGQPWTPVIGTFVDPAGRVRPIYASVGSRRLPDYHRLDVRFSRDFTFARHKMSAYLDLINAYNRRNVSGYSYNGDYSAKEPVNQLPFFPSLGITAEF